MSHPPTSSHAALPALLLVLTACGATVSGPTTGGEDSGRDVAGGQEQDSAPDASPTRDATIRDAPASVDAEFDVYGPPPWASKSLDGCAPDPCEAGQACISQVNYIGSPLGSLCYAKPPQCGAAPTCLCVVEAAYWCKSPACTTDGGLSFSCSTPAPP